jgi:hypothetical protein
VVAKSLSLIQRILGRDVGLIPNTPRLLVIKLVKSIEGKVKDDR